MASWRWTELAVVLIPGILQCLFAARLCPRPGAWRAAAVYEAGLVFILLAGGVLPSGLDILLQIGLLTCIAHYMLGAETRMSAACAILAIALTWISFGIADSALSLLQPSFGLVLPAWLPAVQAAAGTAINLAANAAALRLLPVREEQDMPRILLLLIPVLFVLAAEIVAARYVYTTVRTEMDAAQVSLHSTLLAVQCVGLDALLCTLATYRYLLRSVRAEARVQSLEQARRAQRVHLQETRRRLENTRSLRHDWNNHLRTLSGLLHSGESARAAAYVDALETAAAGTALLPTTGSAVVDVLLADKAETAEAAGIQFRVQPFVLPEDGVDDLDLCVIFSNALDNAISAAASAEGAKRITVSARRQGSLLVFSFANTCLPGPLPVPGIGLSNIRSAAARYGGEYMLKKDGENAQLQVLLCISRPDGHIS